MSTLTVNIRPLFQWRVVLIWLSLLVCLLVPVGFALYANAENVMGYLLVSMYVGLLIGGVQKEVMIRPFTFCLPGHQDIPRRIVLWCVGIINLFLGLAFLRRPDINGIGYVSAILAGASVGVIVSLTSAWCVLSSRHRLKLINFLPLFIVFMILIGTARWLVPFMISESWLVVVFGIAACGLFTVGVKHRQTSMAREDCGQFELGFFNYWDRVRQQRYQQIHAAQRPATSKRSRRSGSVLMAFFVKRMSKHNFFSMGRDFWGELYLFGMERISNTALWKSIIANFVFIFIGGYWVYVGMRWPLANFHLLDIIFIFPFFYALQHKVPAASQMGLPVSRRTIFHTTFLAAMAVTVMCTLFVLAAGSASFALKQILSSYEIRTGSVTIFYQGIHIERFYLCPLVMPIGFMLSLLIPRNGILVSIPGLPIVLGLMAMNYFGQLDLVTWPMAVGAVLFSWLSFWGVLRWHCLQRCLVGAGT